MKIKEFVESNFDMSVIVSHYIPVMKKREICREVLDSCVENVDGFIKIDALKEDILIFVAAMQHYTNLKFDQSFDGMIADFDLLCVSGMFDALIKAIGNDYDDLMTVLEYEEDALLESNSIEAQVAKVANSLVNSIHVVEQKITNAIGDFDLKQMIPEGMSVEDIKGIVNLLQ